MVKSKYEILILIPKIRKMYLNININSYKE